MLCAFNFLFLRRSDLCGLMHSHPACISGRPEWSGASGTPHRRDTLHAVEMQRLSRMEAICSTVAVVRRRWSTWKLRVRRRHGVGGRNGFPPSEAVIRARWKATPVCRRRVVPFLRMRAAAVADLNLKKR